VKVTVDWFHCFVRVCAGLLAVVTLLPLVRLGVLRKNLRQRKGTTGYYFFFHSSQNSLTVPGPYPA
jgi:hypothetical protein